MQRSLFCPGARAVVHGSGCTAFWPGSHRQPACLQLGAAASTRLCAVVAGAPMEAGDALLYAVYTIEHIVLVVYTLSLYTYVCT